MKNKDKYRIAVSFMLLILYLFIAIPSCLWHKHDINIVKYSLKNGIRNHLFSILLVMKTIAQFVRMNTLNILMILLLQKL